MGECDLLMEVWEDFGEDGESLPALIDAGPGGEAARRLLGPAARLVTTIWAGSHFEAMTAYYKLMGWGDYTTDQPSGYQPFPEEWAREQQRAGIVRRSL